MRFELTIIREKHFDVPNYNMSEDDTRTVTLYQMNDCPRTTPLAHTPRESDKHTQRESQPLERIGKQFPATLSSYPFGLSTIRGDLLGRVPRALPARARTIRQLHKLPRQAALGALAAAQGDDYARPGQVDRGRPH